MAVASVEVHEDFDSIDAMESGQPPSIGTILGGGDPDGLPGAVPTPARPRSLSLVPEITEVADPSMVPDGVSVAYVDESADDMKLGRRLAWARPRALANARRPVSRPDSRRSRRPGRCG